MWERWIILELMSSFYGEAFLLLPEPVSTLFASLD